MVARRRRPAEAQCTRSLGLGDKMCAVTPVAGHRTHGTTFRVLEVTSRARSLPCRFCIRNVMAKFHYTGPTGPDQTKSADFCRRLVSAVRVSRKSPRGSARVRSGPCNGIQP